MPELPEVETIVREMRDALVGKILKRVFIFDRKLSGQTIDFPLKIESVERLGKYIVCNMTRARLKSPLSASTAAFSAVRRSSLLAVGQATASSGFASLARKFRDVATKRAFEAGSGGIRCLVHLRMTGELLLEKKPSAGSRKPVAAIAKHERARFHFHDGSILRFVDIRRFGTIEWRDKREPLPSLGLDPLSKKFTPQNFAAALKNSSRVIKSLLLDQRLVAGIGNIYADEALWTAKMHPKRRGDYLKPSGVRRLVLAIKNVLKEAIKKGGSTMRDYRRLDGSTGEYQRSRKVYNREGERCFRCGVKIKRIRVGGRSAYFCPKCQK